MSDERGHGAGAGQERPDGRAETLPVRALGEEGAGDRAGGEAAPGDPEAAGHRLRPDEEVRALLEATDLRDQIAEIRDGPLRARSREIATLLLVATAFAVLGAIVGTSVYVIAAVVTIWTVVPITRRMALTDRLRRLERELASVEDRLLPSAAEGTPEQAGQKPAGDSHEEVTRGLDRSGEDLGESDDRDRHP